MPLVAMTVLLDRARRFGYGVGYFEAWDSYSLEAVRETAEVEESPVILGFGCMMADRVWLENGGIETLAGAGRVHAERASVPVSLLLNETQTFEQAARAPDLGFNAVMPDTSEWLPETVVKDVARLVALAHARGVSVEAEVGHLPAAEDPAPSGRNGDSLPPGCSNLTDPTEAAAFVRETGVDCLAVSIGNIHLLTDRWAKIDLPHLREIRRHVPVPLAIHGGSGFPPGDIPAAITSGVAKFNVGTVLKHVFAEELRRAVGEWPSPVPVHDVLGSHGGADFMNAAKAAMKRKVRELMRLYGSSGHARD